MLRKWITFTLLVILASCSPYKRYRTIDDNFWKRNRAAEPTINIGYLDIQAAGDSRKTRTNLMSSIVFHLKSRGFSVTDIRDYSGLLEGKDLPQTRRLSDKEVLLLAGSIKERFLFQGVYQETTQFAIPADLTSVSLAISVYDARTGKHVGEFRLYGTELKDYNLLSVFNLTERFADDFHSAFQEGSK
jgi:hypothetical protein